MKKSLIIACDGEAASGKSTGAKLISKKYKLLLINSGLLYRYASKLIIDHNPKNQIQFLKRKFNKINYKNITKLNLHNQKIDEHVGPLAKIKSVRLIMQNTQKNLQGENVSSVYGPSTLSSCGRGEVEGGGGVLKSS